MQMNLASMVPLWAMVDPARRGPSRRRFCRAARWIKALDMVDHVPRHPA